MKQYVHLAGCGAHATKAARGTAGHRHRADVARLRRAEAGQEACRSGPRGGRGGGGAIEPVRERRLYPRSSARETAPSTCRGEHLAAPEHSDGPKIAGSVLRCRIRDCFPAVPLPVQAGGQPEGVIRPESDHPASFLFRWPRLRGGGAHLVSTKGNPGRGTAHAPPRLRSRPRRARQPAALVTRAPRSRVRPPHRSGGHERERRRQPDHFPVRSS